MAKIDSNIKQEILLLSKKEMVKLIVKAASTHKQFYDYLMVNYIDKANGEQELFIEAKRDMELLFIKPYKGFSEELRLANMLAACNKRINAFGKICKDKSLEMDLIMQVLEVPFSFPPDYFGTCFTRLNQQVYLLIKKAITLYKNKLHQDYHIQYTSKINQYLRVLHGESDYLDYINSLPSSI
jgi:hypothetical protein